MPPEDELDIEELDSSSMMDEAGVSKETEKPAASASSTEQDVSNIVGEDDALSIVRDVVDKSKSDQAAVSSTKSEEAGDLAGAQAPLAKPDNENFSDVPFNKHPRFQALLGELKEEKRHAELSRNIENFLDDSGLERAEAADGLRLMALAKSDPVKAWTELRPWVESVIRAAGEVLPDDIAARVQNGQLDHETALMLSRERARTNSVETRQSFAEQRAARQREFDAQQQTQSAVTQRMTVAQAWEDERRVKDPNFDTKLPAIVAEVRNLQSMGWVPQTEEAVAEQLRRAYASVNAKVARQNPVQSQKPATRPVMGGQINGTTRPAKPTTTMEIIQAEIAKRNVG